MQKLNYTNLNNLKALTLNLFATAGLAVAQDGNKMAYSTLEAGQKQTLANKSIGIQKVDTLSNPTYIKEISISAEGVLVKIMGQMNPTVIRVIERIAVLMREQKLDVAFFPGLSSDSVSSLYLATNKMDFSLLKKVADAKLCSNQVVYVTTTDQFELRSLALLTMKAEKCESWHKLSTIVTSYNEKIVGLGRMSAKTGTLPVTLVSGKVTLCNIAEKTNEVMTFRVAKNTICLGVMRLCDKIDHALQVSIGTGQIMFGHPAMAAVATSYR